MGQLAILEMQLDHCDPIQIVLSDDHRLGLAEREIDMNPFSLSVIYCNECHRIDQMFSYLYKLYFSAQKIRSKRREVERTSPI